MNALSVIEQDDTPILTNIEAEAALLGAMMQQAKLVDPVADIVNMEDFAFRYHGVIFTIILGEAAQGRAATPLTIKPALMGDPSFEEVGGMQYLAQLTGNAAAMVGAIDIARQIADLARRRRFLEGLEAIIDAASDTSAPLADALADAEQAIAGASLVDIKRESSAGDCIGDVLASFDNPQSRIRSGIKPIDSVLGEPRAGNLVIMAGRPGMGKSAVAISYASAAAAQGFGGLVFSLEMSREEVGQRLASDWLFGGPVGVPFSCIESGSLARSQITAIMDAKDEIEQLPLQVIDKPAITVGAMSRMVRRWKRRYEARGQRLDFIMVDYLQLLHADRRDLSEYERVTEVSRTLKEIAKEHGVVIFALSQLSRAVEQRHDKRPMLSDLRQSGQIEQDADAVMFLYREEYYLKAAEPPEHHADRFKWNDRMAEAQGKIEYIVAKRRHGQPGTAIGEWHGAYQAVR